LEKNEQQTKNAESLEITKVEEMNEGETVKECACSQKLSNLLFAAHPTKKSSLMKVTCADCGKVFWSDRETQYCFDCEAKRKKSR